VCVRLESYESKEHQDMVRSFLNGRFENTAFCLLAPDGKTRLSATARSPGQAIRDVLAKAFPGHEHEVVIQELNRVAAKYPLKNPDGVPVLQDFHSFRQALNVASGDQRLLFYVNAKGESMEALRKSLRPFFAHPDVMGKYHVDLSSPVADAEWAEAIKGTSGEEGLYVLRADPFGQTGKVMKRLPLDASLETMATQLAEANEAFAAEEKRKVYSEHVVAGRRNGVYFTNGMPYGEDRDGDGKIDSRGGGRGQNPLPAFGAGERRGPPNGRRPRR